MGHTERKDLLAMFMGLTIFDKLFNKSSERLKELTGLLKEYRNDDFTKKLVEYSNALIQAESAFNEENRLAGEQTKQRDATQQSIVDETAKLVPLESNIPALVDSEALKQKCGMIITEVSGHIETWKKQKSELENQVNLMEVEVKKMEELELSKHYKEYQQLLAQRNSLQAQIEKKKVYAKCRRCCP
jgi:hypothetical protein